MRGTNYHINRQLSIVSYFLILSLLFGSSLWPMILSQPEEAKATVGNMHLFWAGGAAPSGWTIVSDGLGEAFYEKFIKGAATYSGTGTTSTHTHTLTTSVIDGDSEPRDGKAGATHSSDAHTHSASTLISTNSHLPEYKQMMVIEYATGMPTTIPNGAIAMFDATPPSGWSQISTHNGLFMRGKDNATSTGGTATHTHEITTTLSYASGLTGVVGKGSIASRYDHTHTLGSSPYTTSAESNSPAFVDVILASKTSDGSPSLGMIAFFDDTLSYGWTSISGVGGALNGKYIRANATAGSTGGSNTHTHDDAGTAPPYIETTACVAYDEAGYTGAAGAVWGGHKHNITFTDFQTISNEPPYIEVIFAKRTAAYSPESNNWRWYADEQTDAPATPVTPYAAENTVPPQEEMGKSIGFKLRINFTEVEGVAGNESRKKIQYSTSTGGPWTEVGSTTDTNKLFRYYNGGGVDNAILPSALISESSSTTGIHDESNSTGPTNSDHPASTTVEFEYCIENYSAGTNLTFYFSFNDEIYGNIPLGSTKSYPSLTTAKAYTLSVTAPSSVYMGSFQIGSGSYAEYMFLPDEEITVRDNRGQTSGNSSGWSLTADMTTELNFVVTPGDISSPQYSGSSGMDDMTINAGSDFTGSVTTYYVVEIDGESGRPDTFKWSDDGGSTWDGTRVPCFINLLLNNGIRIDFGSSSGHLIGDVWTFTATPAVLEKISKSTMSFTTGSIKPLFAADTTGITGVTDESMSSAVTAATVAGSNKQGLGGFQINPTLRVYGADTVGDYTGVLTFTLI